MNTPQFQSTANTVPTFTPNSYSQNPSFAALNAMLMQQEGQQNSQFQGAGQINPYTQFGGQFQPVQQQNLGNAGQAAGQQVMQGYNAQQAQNASNAAIQSGGGQDLGPNNGGAQTSGLMQNAGASLASVCCFIMIEGHNGYLPWFIRPIRDLSYKRNSCVAAGYKWMAKWLCPLMRKSELVKDLVKILCIQPLTEHCGYIVSETNCRNRVGYQRFWFSIWNVIGKLLKKD